MEGSRSRELLAWRAVVWLVERSPYWGVVGGGFLDGGWAVGVGFEDGWGFEGREDCEGGERPPMVVMASSAAGALPSSKSEPSASSKRVLRVGGGARRGWERGSFLRMLSP